MLVKDLITFLQQCPQNSEVLVEITPDIVTTNANYTISIDRTQPEYEDKEIILTTNTFHSSN